MNGLGKQQSWEESNKVIYELTIQKTWLRTQLQAQIKVSHRVQVHVSVTQKISI